MPTNTTNYNLQKPLVNNAVDQDIWGNEINDDLDDIDTLLKSGITITPQSSQTAGFTASSSINIKYLYPCDSTGGSFSATLPLASSAGSGSTVYIKKTDGSSNVVTVTRSGADTIDGSTTYTLNIQNQCEAFVSDGISKWYVLTEGITVIPTIPDASTSVKGIVQLATNSDASAGVSTTLALTPSNIGSMNIMGALHSVQSFTSSGTWTKPAGINKVFVVVIGGGGGGASGGGTSSFGSHCSASGGAIGSGGAPSGGIGSNGTVNLRGGGGSSGEAGGSAPYGGGGGSTGNSGGNYGGGGGGSGSNYGGGGGGCALKFITTPGATETVTIGSGGGGASGVGAGAGGIVIVYEYS